MIVSEEQMASLDPIHTKSTARFNVTWLILRMLARRAGQSKAINEDLDTLLNVLSKQESDETNDEMIRAVELIKILFET